MDLLSGVGGCCSSTDKVESLARRDSSISLDDGAYKRRTPEPVKSPLSFDLGIFDEPNLHGPTLPTPSIASSPSVVAPMDVYLRCDESHESRMIRFSGTVLRQYKHTELEDISPAGTCSWEFVSAQIPNTPVLQPALSPKPTANPPHASGHKNIMSGSDMSELALSVDSQPLSDDMERYEEAIAEYKAASKRYKQIRSKVSKGPRVFKDRPRRRGEKRKAEE